MTQSFEFIKTSLANLTGFFAGSISTTIFLATEPIDCDFNTAKNQFESLTKIQQDLVYGKVWELCKMKDPRISGPTWGQDHVFDDKQVLANALHRLGFLGNRNLFSFLCLPFGFGEGGIGAQYFSLGEKLGRDPLTGHISIVNGMGIPTLHHAGCDAAIFSDKFANGNNIHCVYHPTHQNSPSRDIAGFWADVLRMQAVNGGCFMKTSYLIAQQWIDFFREKSGQNQTYLQVGVSEGAVHVNGALRLIQAAKPDLLSKIRVINLAPAYFILPEEFPTPGFQVMNLVKLEDNVINPWGTNTSKIGNHAHIKIVPHTVKEDHPHNQLSNDFVNVGKPLVDMFMKTGNIY